MNLLDNLPNESIYQFPRWPSTLSRSYSSFQPLDKLSDTTNLALDNRNQYQRPDSSSSTSKRIFQYHVRVPTGSGPVSPPPPHTSLDLDIKPDRFLARSTSSRRCRSIPVRIKPTSLSISVSKNKEEFTAQNFPRQTFEQRTTTRERKRRKQQAKVLADKYAETDTWFQLKRSLSELKRLATSQDIQIDSNTSFFNCDTQALKDVIDNAEEKSVVLYQAPSVASSSLVSSNESNRTSISRTQSLFSRPQTTKTYPRFVYEPLIIASKPIYPLLLPNHHTPSKKSRLKSSASSIYRSRQITTPLTEEKRARLLISDLSNENNPPNSISPSPPMVKIEREIPLRKTSTPSQLTSTIKLKHQIPRCHSATDIKHPPSILKHSLRFILICDQEHRIESWYHQYPFIHSDDLLLSFESKSSQQKPTISAYFIEDFQSSKTMLQGKPFHINNDWKKYDVIFISNSVYDEIMIHLQTIINLLKSSGKFIQIYQINHDEDLRKQVKIFSKQKHF